MDEAVQDIYTLREGDREHLERQPTIGPKPKLHVKKLTDEEKEQLSRERATDIDESDLEPSTDHGAQTVPIGETPKYQMVVRLPKCPTCRSDMIPDPNTPTRPGRRRVRFTLPQETGKQVPQHKKPSRKKPVVYTDDEYEEGLPWKCMGEVWTGKYEVKDGERKRVMRPCTTRIHIRQ